MQDSAILLDSKILENSKELKLIDYWLKVLNRPQGWHYDLDIVWILKELEKNKVYKGSTILDAGAGLGITQFILASLGYNVISLDFSDRVIPKYAKRIFNIEKIKNDAFNYEHDYINFVTYTTEQRVEKIEESNRNNVLFKLKNKFINLYFKFRNYFYFVNELTKSHKDYGKITFIRDAFHKIHLNDNTVDAVVSVSAIEHADRSLLKDNLNEFRRVVKVDGPILISTSANNETQLDSFHKKTKGICFSKKSISDFGYNLIFKEFDYKFVESKLLNDDLFINRIDRYYSQDPDSEFYKKRMKKFPYLPVGIMIFKNHK